MNMVQRLESWGDAHHTRWLEVMRIILGFIILGKGIAFISDTEALDTLIRESRLGFVSFILTHYVATAHLIGGILIILGLLTRVAILFQIPILIGAVVFINATKGFSALNSELSLSILVLLMLLFFLVYGSGPWSLDEYMKTHKET
jgi:putative oxidoreductase